MNQNAINAFHRFIRATRAADQAEIERRAARVEVAGVITREQPVIIDDPDVPGERWRIETLGGMVRIRPEPAATIVNASAASPGSGTGRRGDAARPAKPAAPPVIEPSAEEKTNTATTTTPDDAPRQKKGGKAGEQTKDA